MVRQNLLIGIFVFAFLLSGCDGKNGSSSISGPGTPTPNTTEQLKSPEDMMKTVSKMSIQEEKTIEELKTVLSLGYPEKVKVAAIEKLGKSSKEKATEVLKDVWKNAPEEILRNNAIKALVFQNTEASRNALKEVLSGNDIKSKKLVLNLIGYTGKLDFKALVELGIADQNAEVSALAQKIKVKLNKI